MRILGISCFYHDSAVALVIDGKLACASHEERFSRKKHDPEFPRNAIDFCLRYANLRPQDLDYVVFYDKPLVKFIRILETVFQTYPRSLKVFRESSLSWLLDRLWLKSHIQQYLDISPEKILFCKHHLSHAGSAFLCSPFEESAIVTVDGVGEWATTAIGYGKGSEVKLYREIRFPHSLGLLYSTFTAFLGFEVNEGEYKVMGMAGFGKPRYLDKIHSIVRLHDDGSFELDMDYFAYHRSVSLPFSNKFVSLFGKPRSPDSKFFTRSTGYPSYFGDKPQNYEELARSNERYADIASSIQAFLEEAMLSLVNEAHQLTGSENLCLAGGVALNCVANGRILRDGPFKRIFIQPSAGDAGGALGCALYAANSCFNEPRSFVLDHALWGESFSPSQVHDALMKNHYDFEELPSEDHIIETCVEELLAGRVVGWFRDRAEWGPRALGARSILADPRRPDMKDTVNTKIKFREPFRPFAPSAIIESSSEYFDLPNPDQHYPPRFMLYVTDVREDFRQKLPAITHIDGTTRPQTVYHAFTPVYWRLLKRFGEATGFDCLLNTSFNLKGEPIVNSPEDALDTFARSGLDTLVLENFIVRKQT